MEKKIGNSLENPNDDTPPTTDTVPQVPQEPSEKTDAEKQPPSEPKV